MGMVRSMIVGMLPRISTSTRLGGSNDDKDEELDTRPFG
jgi:hypothetical protein